MALNSNVPNKTCQALVPVVGVIYLVTNRISGKQYIGQTRMSIAHRWRAHIRAAKEGRKYPISHAIRKYGKEGFTVTMIASASSLDGLNALETWYIAILKTVSPYGYNLDSGGKNFWRHPQTSQRISAAKKGKKLGPYKPRSPEHSLKLSLARKGKPAWMKGRKWSDESRARLSVSVKGRKGYPHTAEFKAELSLRNKGNTYAAGYKQPPEHRDKRIANGMATKRANAAIRSQRVNSSSE